MGKPPKRPRAIRRKTGGALVELFAVIGTDPQCGTARLLQLARLTDPGKLIPCGWAGSGLNESGGRKIRVALDTGRPIIAEVEFRGFTSAGEPRRPVIRRWHAG